MHARFLSRHRSQTGRVAEHYVQFMSSVDVVHTEVGPELLTDL